MTYKIALLEMIPAYYSNTSGNLVEVEPPDDAKDAMIHVMDESLLPHAEPPEKPPWARTLVPSS